MALSDYLTDDEWDACFYAYAGPSPIKKDLADASLGGIMHACIDRLLKLGYDFIGLDADGDKQQQVPSNNPAKLMAAMGLQPDRDLLIQSLVDGRRFWQEHDPSMLSESDDEWADQLAQVQEAS